MARIFISYKHTDPDQQLAAALHDALKGQHEVFIDTTLTVGMKWAERIENAIKQTDFLITLLSEASVASEMCLAEIETAHHLAKSQQGKPVILPVRVAYFEPLVYPLSAYLNAIQWATWKGHDDTPALITQLQRAIGGGDLVTSEEAQRERIQVTATNELPAPMSSARPIKLELPEGTMDPESGFYVERDSDAIASDALHSNGVTITIKGPRQMGKSSLLTRIMRHSMDADKPTAFLDFQLFDRSALQDPDSFFYQFCLWLSDALEMEDKVDEYWNTRLGNSQRCTRYVERYLLKELDRPVMIAMDEVDAVFDTAFRTDFFSMLRSWHNSRAMSKLWRQTSLVLVTSTEPYQFIENLNLSPFNVGEVIELQDFTPAQVSDLNRRHNMPISTDQEAQLMQLIHGHPYLIRKALYLLASGRHTFADLIRTAPQENGPFGDHLRYHLFRLTGKDDLVAGMWGVLKHNVCSDDRIFFRLRGAGLVRREGNAVLPRNELYKRFFELYLD